MGSLEQNLRPVQQHLVPHQQQEGPPQQHAVPLQTQEGPPQQHAVPEQVVPLFNLLECRAQGESGH